MWTYLKKKSKEVKVLIYPSFLGILGGNPIKAIKLKKSKLVLNYLTVTSI